MNPVKFNKVLNPQLENIRKTFELFGWEWLSFPECELIAPSEKQIQMTYNKIYNELMADDNVDEISHGRLLVRKMKCDGQFMGIEIMFEVGSIYSEDDEEEIDLPIQPEEL